MAAVLITVRDGTVDYVIDGNVNVALIDLDRYDRNRAFPDDVDADLAKLRALPDMPWTRELAGFLRAIKLDITQCIRNND